MAHPVTLLLKTAIPRSFKVTGKNALASIVDLRSKRHKQELFGEWAPFVPPLRKMHDGPKSYAVFRDNGEEYLKFMIELARLTPHDRILDVGCGIGRKTIPLLRYLSTEAEYVGTDIVRSGIEWCQDRISPVYPNFQFQHIDVWNGSYNPTGNIRPSDYRFPFDDDFFDFILLGSVFTHMLTEEVDNYLSEMARVLKPGGRALITYFLLNEAALELIETGKSTRDIRHAMGSCKVENRSYPEDAVGHFEADVARMHSKHGLQLEGSIHHGSWCGREEYLSYQDIAVVTKRHQIIGTKTV